MSQKVVICGAGFLGSHIARAIAQANNANLPLRQIAVASRSPRRVHELLGSTISPAQLLPPVTLDITKPETLTPAFETASYVISMVGLLHGRPEHFDHIQWKGAENVAKAASRAGAKLVHVSAIGADASSPIPYNRTKALAESSVLDICGNDATIIRPSVAFGPDDDFFNRFAKLAKWLPFLPVFGGGMSKFQPVYAGDIGRYVEILTRSPSNAWEIVGGQIIEAGGPEVFTFRELMELVLRYSGRRRPVVSLPYAFGTFQGLVLERLPTTLFTVTRSQVEQLKLDNVAKDNRFKTVVEGQSGKLVSIYDVLPTYL